MPEEGVTGGVPATHQLRGGVWGGAGYVAALSPPLLLLLLPSMSRMGLEAFWAEVAAAGGIPFLGLPGLETREGGKVLAGTVVPPSLALSLGIWVLVVGEFTTVYLLPSCRVSVALTDVHEADAAAPLIGAARVDIGDPLPAKAYPAVVASGLVDTPGLSATAQPSGPSCKLPDALAPLDPPLSQAGVLVLKALATADASSHRPLPP